MILRLETLSLARAGSRNLKGEKKRGGGGGGTKGKRGSRISVERGGGGGGGAHHLHTHTLDPAFIPNSVWQEEEDGVSLHGTILGRGQTTCHDELPV